MLPAEHKFTSPAQFHRTITRGRRAGSRTLVVHLWEDPAGASAFSGSISADSARSADSAAPALIGGPRFGLIVAKSVGNAVVRHRTSRRLRHVLAALIPELNPAACIVVRALPAAGQASSAELRRDVTKALRKIQERR